MLRIERNDGVVAIATPLGCRRADTESGGCISGDVVAQKVITTSTGAYLSDPGGVWTNSSDVNRPAWHSRPSRVWNRCYGTRIARLAAKAAKVNRLERELNAIKEKLGLR